MDVAALLRPFIDDLTPSQLNQVSVYIDLLLRWNAKMNLTAIRDPESIVTRHFGESFFLSRILTEKGIGPAAKIIDVGSGAGFPGIPLKIARPTVALSLVEAQQRKAVFLREVLRALNLDAEVNNSRAENMARMRPASADVVTLRAVEKFETILPVAAGLVNQTGKLAVLIGRPQVTQAQNLLKNWVFEAFAVVPGSESRVILVGNHVG